MRWGMLIIVAAAASAWAQGDEEKPGIAVFDLKGIDTRPTEAEAATNAVARGLRELDAFEVLSSEDMRNLLSIERQKQLLGMENDTNVSASVQALGVKNFVVGSVTRTGAGLSAELRLLDPKQSKVVSQRTIAPQPSLDKLATQLSGIVQELVGPLLFMEQGQLLVRTHEEGAEVLVDDVSRGSTPLPAPVKLARGRHRLTIKKDGFIARVTVTTVRKEQLTLEDVTLVPSADYVAAYNARNKRLRIGGFAATAVAVVALVVGIGLDRGVAENTYQNDFKPRQAVLQAVSSGTASAAAFPSGVQNACFIDQAGCRTQAQGDAAAINGLQIAAWTLVGLAGVAAIAAAYCFISGDDPSRYSQLVASLMTGSNAGSASSSLFPSWW
jgi:hypothetical protein